MRAIKSSVLLLLLSILLAAPAFAGGWWSSIGLEGQPVGLGESVDLKVSEVMFDSIEDAEEAKEQDFYAYLVADFDKAALDEAMSRPHAGDWWTPLSEPILVGSVELMGWDSNLADGRVELDVPQIPPGSYYLMLCDAGCEVALGNLIPSRINVTDDVLAAQTTRRLQRAEAHLTLALQRSRSELRETRSTLRQALSDDARQDQDITRLESELIEAQKPDSPPWTAYAGWFFAGLAAAFLLLQRRKVNASGDQTVVERIPDDARELINAP